jgi:hypothetical protein
MIPTKISHNSVLCHECRLKCLITRSEPPIPMQRALKKKAARRPISRITGMIAPVSGANLWDTA